MFGLFIGLSLLLVFGFGFMRTMLLLLIGIFGVFSAKDKFWYTVFLILISILFVYT